MRTSRPCLVAALVCAFAVNPAAGSAQSSGQKRAVPRRAAPAAQARKPPARTPPARAVPRPPAPRPPVVRPYYRSYAYVPYLNAFSLGFYVGYPYGSFPYYAYPSCPTEAEEPGSLRIDVPQKEATVFVDGYFVGVVDDFDGVLHRLDLEPGPHRIEIRAPGYQAIAFEVNLQPGQTITYRGTMQAVTP